jgi:hypothetical protein
MTRLLALLLLLGPVTALEAFAQGRGAPNPAVVAAVEHVKDKCTRETPCKYKTESAGAHTLVTVEFTRKETPTSQPRPYPGGRARLTIDAKGNLVKRVDGD